VLCTITQQKRPTMTATDETEEQWLPLGADGDEAFKFTAP
jgi:hypothetical protein